MAPDTTQLRVYSVSEKSMSGLWSHNKKEKKERKNSSEHDCLLAIGARTAEHSLL
jgi:hypothetical protein